MSGTRVRSLGEEVLDVTSHGRVGAIDVLELRVQVGYGLVQQETNVSPAASPDDDLRLILA